MSGRQKHILSEQGKRFVKTARALGCDELEARFDAALKNVAMRRPVEVATKKPAPRKSKS